MLKVIFKAMKHLFVLAAGAVLMMMTVVSCGELPGVGGNDADNSYKPLELSTKAAGFVEKGSSFTFDYIDRINKEADEDFVVSPLSMQFLLGMLLDGAKGETAAQIACLVRAKHLLILTSTEGIYKDSNDPSTLIEEINGKDTCELLENITACENYCNGASRAGANGAKAKLEYVKEAVKIGTEVIIAQARHTVADLLSGKAKATRIRVR